MLTNREWMNEQDNTTVAKIISGKHLWNCPPDTYKNGECPGATVGCVNCWVQWLERPHDLLESL